jgi:hypothetical protein
MREVCRKWAGGTCQIQIVISSVINLVRSMWYTGRAIQDGFNSSDILDKDPG